MGIFRSETMELYRITIPKDDAYRVIEGMGNMAQCHFIDLNKSEQAFSLPYSSRIKAAEDCERRLTYLMNKCKESRIRVIEPKNIEDYKRRIVIIAEEKRRAVNLLFDALDTDVQEKERFVVLQSKTIQEMKANINIMKDRLEVLEFVYQQSAVIGNARPAQSGRMDQEMSGSINPNNVDGDFLVARDGQNIEGGVSISFVAGTIKDSEKERMTRLLFRTTRGKALTYFHDFDQGDVKKAVYMVVYQDGSMIRDRVQKICDSFMGQRFEVPPLSNIKLEVDSEILKIQNSESLLRMSEGQLVDYLMSINRGPRVQGASPGTTPSRLELYAFYMAKEKAILTALNMLKQRDNFDVTLTGFIWAPLAMEVPIKFALQKFPAVEFNAWRQNENDEMLFTPPTYFKDNDVITTPQLITNTYGVPNYGEANPACFTIVTFPFLFAVMFGDYGHGSLILALGTFFVMFHEKLQNTPLKVVAPFRYFVFMMGFFSCYIGLIYNEWFAIPYDWFGTCYDPSIEIAQKNFKETPSISGSYNFYLQKGTDLNDYTSQEAYDCVYAFGLDPTWFLSENEILTVQNSVKMKMAVIIGVSHMMMGIIVKGLNVINHKQWIIFGTEVVTGVLILGGLFGWMDFLIFSKWFFHYYAYNFVIAEGLTSTISGQSIPVTNTTCWEYEKQYNNVANAPSVYTILINNFLSGGNQKSSYAYDVPLPCQQYGYYIPDINSTTYSLTANEYQVFLFPTQQVFSEMFVLIVIFCVPIFLCTKPCMMACKKDEHDHPAGQQFENIDADIDVANDAGQPLIQEKANSLEGNYQQDKLVWEKVLNAEYGLDQHHAHSIGEAFIHQMIETIEFVLGCVSNTASYLRLWALSLAHSQLALVFLEYILPIPWAMCGYESCSTAAITVGSFFSWFVFMSVTFGILMCMDVLECCLHTLRLHWVEFQSKFYKGAGYLYTPFSFDAIFKKQMDK